MLTSSLLGSFRYPRFLSLLACTLALASGGSAVAAPRLLPPLKTVQYVDLAQYSGRWYEIAHAFAPYEEGCVGTTATYTAKEDGTIGVLNACYSGSFDGPLIEIEGTATVADPRTNAKLTVSFDSQVPTRSERTLPGRSSSRPRYLVGNYWIIDLGAEYEYSVVSDPTRTSFWILSRTPTMDAETYEAILADLEADGFDTSKLVITDQTP